MVADESSLAEILIETAQHLNIQREKECCQLATPNCTKRTDKEHTQVKEHPEKAG